jgi:hypothetical protein
MKNLVKRKNNKINYNLFKKVDPLKLNEINKNNLIEHFVNVYDRYSEVFERFLKRDLKELPKIEGFTKLMRSSDRPYYFRGESLRHPLSYNFF